MLEILFRPLRTALGMAEEEANAPLVNTERDILDAVEAIRRASDSIERHVEVIEGLATSVTPLTESVNSLTATMVELTAMLAPLGKAEHDVEQIEHRFGLRRRHAPTQETAGPAEADAKPVTPQSDEPANQP